MNSFNSIKNGSIIINQMIKELQYNKNLQNIYISGTYNSDLTLYNDINTSFNTLTNVGNSDIFITKYNSGRGNGLWATKVSSTNSDIPVIMLLDSSNNIYISGYYIYENLTLYHANGNAFKTLTNSGNNDIFIAKYNSDGSGIWATQIASTGDESPINMILDSSNNLYISGYYVTNVTFYHADGIQFKTLTNLGGYDVFISKYDSDGSGIWVTRVAGSGIDKSVNLLLDSRNNVYINGYYNANLTLYNSIDPTTSTFKTLTNMGGNDIFLAKYNSDGSGIWATQIASTGDESPINMILDSSNNLYISGTYNSNLTLYNSINTSFKEFTYNGSMNTFIAKYNSDGSGIWATRIGCKGTPDMTTFGNTWKPVYDKKTYIGVSLSSDGKYQTVTANSDYIYISSDYGNNWTAKDTSRNWYKVRISSNGMYQITCIYSSYIYISSDYGNNWTAKDSPRKWMGVSISSDGMYQSAVVYNGNVYTSSNYGDNWTAKYTAKPWYCIAMSSDGKYQTGGTSEYIYISSNYGNNWTAKDSPRYWNHISMSSDGKYQTAPVSGNQIYISSNYGNNWTAKDSPRNWSGISITSDGKYQIAVVSGGFIYISSDYGNNWAEKGTSVYWSDVSISSDGAYQTAVAQPFAQIENNFIYISNVNFIDMPTQPVNLTLDSFSNIYISGTYNSQLILYNQYDITNSTFKTLMNDKGINTFIAKYNSDGLGQWATYIGGVGITDITTFGNVWIPKTENYSGLNWRGISISSDGMYQTATTYPGYIYISSNYGNNWTPKATIGYWVNVSISSDGKYQSAAFGGTNVNISSDYGNNWTPKGSSGNWNAISISSSGMYQISAIYNGEIYISSNYGNNWTPKEQVRFWSNVSISSSGMYQTAVVEKGRIYISSNYGNNWAGKDISRNWVNVSMSSSGIYQTAVVGGGYIYISTNYGNNWIPSSTSYGTLNWRGISISSSGQYQTATNYGGKIYISSDYGNNWSAKSSNKDWFYVSMSSDGYYQTATVTYEQIYISNPVVITKPVNLVLDSLNNMYISGTYNQKLITLYNSTNTTFKTLTNDGGTDTFIAKYNRDGSGVWATRISCSGTDQPVNVLLDSVNNVYINGYYNSNVTLYNSKDTTFKTLTNDGGSDTFVAKYNSDGSGIWTTRIAGAGSDVPVNMIIK